jgi:APA family basic amino acid/polyamine antiporter
VVFSISRDGLLPRPLAAMSRYKVPSRATLVAGGAAVVMSQTIDVLTLEQLVVIGSLFAFLFVAAAVLALRRSRPDLHRPFRMPAAPLVVLVTIFAIGWLMLNLNVETWAYFAVWMAVGMALYLVYGRRKSQMKLLLDAPPPERPVAAPMAPAPPPGAALPPGAVPGPWDAYPAPGPAGKGTWPAERRPGAPESPYPTGRYSTERRPGGRFAPEPYPTDPSPQGGAPGRHSSGPYSSPPPRDPYAVDPGVPNPYSSGPYEQGGQEPDPYRPGPYGPGPGEGGEPQEPPQGGRHRR